MRLLLDTNVVLSALLWRGIPYTLLVTASSRPDIRLFPRLPLHEELSDVLKRPLIASRLGAIGRTGKDVLADYFSAPVVVYPASIPKIVTADPDDDYVIAAAMDALADIIGPGDRHLLSLGQQTLIRILQPAESMDALNSFEPGA